MTEEDRKKEKCPHSGDLAVTPENRRAVLRHLENCPSCRKETAENNPSAIFSLLSLQEKKADFWDKKWPPLVGRVFNQPRPRFALTPVPAFRLAVYAAVSLVVFLLAAYFFSERGKEELQPPGTDIARELNLVPAGGKEVFSEVPLVENVEPANALVYDMGIIDENQTRMVHFFNVDIDI